MVQKHKNLQEKSTNIITFIAKRYRDNQSFWGIELLNEPQFSRKNYWILRKFYRRTYRELKKIIRPGTYTVFSDCFRPKTCLGMLRGNKKFPVAMDIHWYSFAEDWSKYTSIETYFAKVAKRAKILKILQLIQPIIVGEWSAVLPEEALKDRTKNERQELVKRHYDLQRQAYNSSLAEFYWNYTSSRASIWNYRAIIAATKTETEHL